MADISFLNWPFFESHHKELAQNVDTWASQNSALFDKSQEDLDASCREIVGALADGGWLNYTIPKVEGGAHNTLDVRSLCLIRETLAKYSGLVDFCFAMQGLGSGAISLFGSDELKASYLPEVASGKKIAAFALSEVNAGSDVANLSTSYKDMGDHYLINGEKTFISNGGIANFYTVFARADCETGSKPISAFVVDANVGGVEIAERIEVIAPHPLARIKFTNCKVPKTHLLGQEKSGFKIAMATLDVFRSTVGAASLGLARRALDEALARANSREIFGEPLFNQQIIQAMLAEMAVDIDASALLIYRAGWIKDTSGARITREAAMAKLHATESAQKTIDKAQQIFGGLGVVKGQKVEELYREIRALRIYEGASEVQKIIIARQLLDQPK